MKSESAEHELQRSRLDQRDRLLELPTARHIRTPRPRVRDRSIDDAGGRKSSLFYKIGKFQGDEAHPSTDCPLMASRVMPTSNCGCNSASEPSLIRLIRGHSSPKIIPAPQNHTFTKTETNQMHSYYAFLKIWWCAQNIINAEMGHCKKWNSF